MERILVDGGSWDGTPQLAANVVGRVWHGPRGLAAQCNYGAQKTNADYLLFVAADSRLPLGWEKEIELILCDTQVAVGGFTLAIRDSHWAFRWIEAGGNFRARLEEIALPDQGLFVRRADFLAIGGMDVESAIPFAQLCRVLRKKKGEFRLSRLRTETSSRKWRTHGLVKTVWHHFITYLTFRFFEST